MGKIESAADPALDFGNRASHGRECSAAKTVKIAAAGTLSFEFSCIVRVQLSLLNKSTAQQGYLVFK